MDVTHLLLESVALQAGVCQHHAITVFADAFAFDVQLGEVREKGGRGVAVSFDFYDAEVRIAVADAGDVILKIDFDINSQSFRFLLVDKGDAVKAVL